MRTRRPVGSLLLASLALAVTGLVAIGCGSDSGSGASTGTTAAGSGVEGAWTLTTYLADGTQVPAAAAPADIDLAANGRFSGSTGCNRISGTWTGSAGGSFTITPGPMTQAACVDPAGQAQEQAFTAGLPKVTQAAVSGSTLTLSDDAGAALFTFTEGPEGLEGSYTVTGVNNGQGAVVSTTATETANITFAADGTVSGNTGCNSFAGTYEVDGAEVTIHGNVAATLMACEPDAQALEQQFLTALGNVTTWERSGQQVTLRGNNGEAQLTLTDA